MTRCTYNGVAGIVYDWEDADDDGPQFKFVGDDGSFDFVNLYQLEFGSLPNGRPIMFFTRIKYRLDQMNMTIRQLADSVGSYEANISRIIAGAGAERTTQDRIATVLLADVSDLFVPVRS